MKTEGGAPYKMKREDRNSSDIKYYQKVYLNPIFSRHQPEAYPKNADRDVDRM